ncbi:immunoglobulin domain-containing protein [Flaviaesturariibacter aridisoli]|uniref:PKD domain-containing protein n=1 Tax=Flaviaesturariibacter aridisoli TaxID=2545761 RepID=A0A4V2WML4_9BACT|nr:immunoglobulin domain-containing protein [Flaviaesturariibacter aridisoli]TCZ70524.1 hypothetical protein E0486_11250 [Flaviaesturariibacter aridisoli]
MRKNVLLCAALAAGVLAACDKKESCSDADRPDITLSADTLTAGSELRLSASSVRGAQYYLWSGPDGFTSTDQQPVITRIQPANAGVYTVEVGFTGGCRVTASSVPVRVGVPAAPCTQAANSTTINGLPTLSFSRTNAYVTGGSWFLEGNSSNGTVELEFPGTERPGPGLYSIPIGTDWGHGYVRLRAVSSNNNWVTANDKVYVTVSAAGKVTAQFCNVATVGQTNNLHSTMSGKISEP